MFDGWPPPVFDPAGPYATSVSWLSWILFGMAAIVLIVVLAALYSALFGRRDLQTKVGGKTAIWIGGIAFPAVVLERTKPDEAAASAIAACSPPPSWMARCTE